MIRNLQREAFASFAAEAEAEEAAAMAGVDEDVDDDPHIDEDDSDDDVEVDVDEEENERMVIKSNASPRSRKKLPSDDAIDVVIFFGGGMDRGIYFVFRRGYEGMFDFRRRRERDKKK